MEKERQVIFSVEKKRGKERETIPQKTKLRKERVGGSQKAQRRKTQSNNGARERKSEEEEEKQSELKS